LFLGLISSGGGANARFTPLADAHACCVKTLQSLKVIHSEQEFKTVPQQSSKLFLSEQRIAADGQRVFYASGSQTFSDRVPFLCPRNVITYHLVPGKVNVPNTIRSKVWKTRIDTNAT